MDITYHLIIMDKFVLYILFRWLSRPVLTWNKTLKGNAIPLPNVKYHWEHEAQTWPPILAITNRRINTIYIWCIKLDHLYRLLKVCGYEIVGYYLNQSWSLKYVQATVRTVYIEIKFSQKCYLHWPPLMSIIHQYLIRSIIIGTRKRQRSLTVSLLDRLLIVNYYEYDILSVNVRQMTSGFVVRFPCNSMFIIDDHLLYFRLAQSIAKPAFVTTSIAQWLASLSTTVSSTDKNYH